MGRLDATGCHYLLSTVAACPDFGNHCMATAVSCVLINENTHTLCSRHLAQSSRRDEILARCPNPPEIEQTLVREVTIV